MCQDDSTTPLWIACYKGQDAVVKTLSEAGANLHQATTVRKCIYDSTMTVSFVGGERDAPREWETQRDTEGQRKRESE